MNFYVLNSEGGRFGTKWAYGEVVEPVRYGTSRKCPVCGEAISGKEYSPPHFIQVSSAKSEKWGDFLWGAGFQLMVSERFRQMYSQKNLRGIESFYPPVEIVRAGRKKHGDLPDSLPTYQLVQIIWNGANLDDAKSHVVRNSFDCAFCRGDVKSLQPIVIEQDSWSGADIFIARGLNGTILVSERFKQAAEADNLRNIWLIPVEKYVYDEQQSGLWHMRK